jgi:hypothetical protein
MKFIISAILVVVLCNNTAFAQMTIQRTVVSSEAARKMGEACEAFAKQKGLARFSVGDR